MMHSTLSLIQVYNRGIQRIRNVFLMMMMMMMMMTPQLGLSCSREISAAFLEEIRLQQRSATLPCSLTHILVTIIKK